MAPRHAKGAEFVRCGWARNELAIEYHDREWGVPQHDDRVLFEFLMLEGAQAGLNWDTMAFIPARLRSTTDVGLNNYSRTMGLSAIG